MNRASNPPQATHEVEVLADRVRITLAGEFDLANEQALTSWLVNAIQAGPGRAVEVDMQDVGFIDSSGIRVLLQAHAVAAQHGGSFRLTRASGTVREVLEIVAVYDYLTTGV
ncbi:STAS domain-containing protein [Catellatospora sichuanensis]|uniref:STAS domain-containing protein n=1 Tax=Catellatospora sichuanensis TaxID=1969805 RepID=UPI0011829340|nr:STAS domain-containing protein [Catellatospora sichuanensis]